MRTQQTYAEGACIFVPIGLKLSYRELPLSFLRVWREAGAPVVRDLSDVLEHVARSDFALGCSA